MARIEIGEREQQEGSGSYLLRNVRVRARMSSLEERITWDTNKGARQRRPGRERQQEKWVKDIPIMELLLPEYQARMEDAAKVITRGWLLASVPPVEVWMGDLILYWQTADLHFSAKVESNNEITTCGFLIDITPAFMTAVPVVAYTSPVQDVVPVRVAGNFDVTGLGGLNLYVLPYATDGNKTAYGIIKHIELPVGLF